MRLLGPTASFLLICFCVISAVFGVAAFIIVYDHTHGGPSLSGARHPLALSDPTVQRLQRDASGLGLWTDIHYHRESHHSPAWQHEPGEAEIICLQTGHYTLSLGVQVGVEEHHHGTVKRSENQASNSSLIAFVCRRCNRYYEIRTVRQRGDERIMLFESHTFAQESGQRFLLKQFVAEVQAGDILHMQFRSRCPRLILTNSTFQLPHEHPVASSILIIT